MSKTIIIQNAGEDDLSFLKAMNWQAVLASPGFIQEYGLAQLQLQEDNYWPSWTPQDSPAFLALDESGRKLGAIILKNHERNHLPVRGWRFGIGVEAVARGQGVGR